MQDQVEPSTGEREPPAEEIDPKDSWEYTNTLAAEDQQLEESQKAAFDDYCRAYMVSFKTQYLLLRTILDNPRATKTFSIWN